MVRILIVYLIRFTGVWGRTGTATNKFILASNFLQNVLNFTKKILTEISVEIQL